MDLRVTLPLSLLLACTSPPNASLDAPQPEEDPGVVVSTTPYKVTYVEPQDTFIPDPEYADLFVTIADTGRNYARLIRTMDRLTERSGAPRMEPPVNIHVPERDSLMVPLDSDDELWRGQYMLRCIAEPTMSIEYLDFYDTAAPPRTMALVTGIWRTREQADSVVRAHGSDAPLHWVIPANLFQGCMH